MNTDRSPEQEPPAEGADDALGSARRERAQLEEKISDLERELTNTRSNLQRLSTRRSVRVALKAAQLGKPVVTLWRRMLSRGRPPAQTERNRAEVVEELRRLRPDPGPTTGPLVTMVVLTRDGAHHLRRLLASLRDNTAYRSFEVVAIDNASTDATPNLLAQDWGFPLRVIRNDSNQSFSRGCNQGIEAAGGEYILLLNNDVDPINDGWLGEMVAALERDPILGAVGALLVYPKRPGYQSPDPNTGPDLTVQHRGIAYRWRRNAPRSSTIPWAYNIGVGEDPTSPWLVSEAPVPAVTAACLLAPKELLDDLGGLDESFTYGMEDVDLSIRIRRAGRSVAIVGKAALFHHEFGTQSEAGQARRRAYGLGNVQAFAEKWGPLLSRLLDLETLDPEPQGLRASARPLIAITVTEDRPQAGWGDWYTAHELGDAFEQAGFGIVYAAGKDESWYQLGEDIAVVICLIDGYDVRRAPTNAITVAWVRNWTDRWISRPWFGCHDAYVPSSTVTSNLLQEAGVPVTDVIPLATNPERFRRTSPDATYANDIAITSNYWDSTRPGIEELIVRPGESVAIYGKGWEKVPRLARYVRGHLPYDELVDVYNSSKIVIDETATPTLPYGALNSRVFDALACGALVITNNRAGSEEVFAGALPAYESPSHQRELLDDYLGDEEKRRRTVEHLQRIVLSEHTYQQRITQIPNAVRGIFTRPRIALKIGSPNQVAAPHWGDTHFAGSLAASLRRLDTNPEIHLLADWETPASQCIDVVVHIRGLGQYVPKPSHLNILWIISHPEDITLAECASYDAVLVASPLVAAGLDKDLPIPVEVMYQATDPEMLAREYTTELPGGVLFVGNSRGQRRMAVEIALEAEARLRVYGQGWDDRLPPGVCVADHVPNEQLGSVYRAADVVLNDHWPDMAAKGFISNRVFDVLAAGGILFTDPVNGLEEVFGDLIPTFSTAADLRYLLEDLSAHRRSYLERMAEARQIVLDGHTFDVRAARIRSLIDDLGWSAKSSITSDQRRKEAR